MLMTASRQTRAGDRRVLVVRAIVAVAMWPESMEVDAARGRTRTPAGHDRRGGRDARARALRRLGAGGRAGCSGSSSSRAIPWSAARRCVARLTPADAPLLDPAPAPELAAARRSRAGGGRAGAGRARPRRGGARTRAVDACAASRQLADGRRHRRATSSKRHADDGDDGARKRLRAAEFTVTQRRVRAAARAGAAAVASASGGAHRR